jgi:hypothetical protein
MSINKYITYRPSPRCLASVVIIADDAIPVIVVELLASDHYTNAYRIAVNRASARAVLVVEFPAMVQDLLSAVGNGTESR